jgi:hypothetical protein
VVIGSRCQEERRRPKSQAAANQLAAESTDQRADQPPEQ